MTAATVHIRDVQAQWAELIQLVLAGNEVLLTQAQKPVMRLVPVANGGKPRVAGLHVGMGWMSDDFDDLKTCRSSAETLPLQPIPSSWSGKQLS